MHALLRRVPRIQMIAVFECAARCESFTAAAGELGMTQSAVSRHINALERTIGHQLFTRSANRVALNHSGEQLLTAVTRGLDTIRQALDTMTAASPAFLLAANPGFAQQWLVPYLDQLQTVVADIDLRLRLFDRDADLASEAFDAAIHLAPIATTPPTSRVLFEERVLPVASPELADSVGLDEYTPPHRLLDLDKLHLDPRDRQWMDWTTWFAAHDLQWAATQAKLSYNNYALVLNDAVSGRGVALAWRGLVDPLLTTGTLVAVGPETHRPDVAYQLIPSPETPPGTIGQLADWLHDLIG